MRQITVILKGRRKCTKAILGIFTAMTFAGQVGAATIDFDTSPVGAIADGTAVTNQYSSLGVVFSVFENGAEQSDGPLATTAFDPPAQAGNRLSNFFGNGIDNFDNRADELRISFTSAVSNVFFDFFPQGDSTGLTRVVASNSGGTISDNFTGITGSQRIETYNVVGSSITQISIFQPTDVWNWGLDNLNFTPDATPAPVPVPASLPLLVFGLGGLGLMVRCKQKLS